MSQSPGTMLYFQYLKKKEKNKLKQSEIEVKMIIKMDKQFLLELANNFYERY